MTIKIVCIGDSITAGYGLYRGENWTDIMQNKYGQIELINRGISGDTTEGMRTRFERHVIREQPDYVTIFGGLNDFFLDVSPEEVAENYRSMILYALDESIVPIPIITQSVEIGILNQFYPGMDHSFVDDRIKRLSHDLIPAIRSELIDSNPVIPILDLYVAFKDFMPSDAIQSLYSEDGVHLSAKGAAFIASCVEKLFSQLELER